MTFIREIGLYHILSPDDFASSHHHDLLFLQFSVPILDWLF